MRNLNDVILMGTVTSVNKEKRYMYVKIDKDEEPFLVFVPEEAKKDLFFFMQEGEGEPVLVKGYLSRCKDLESEIGVCAYRITWLQAFLRRRKREKDTEEESCRGA